MSQNAWTEAIIISVTSYQVRLNKVLSVFGKAMCTNVQLIRNLGGITLGDFSHKSLIKKNGS